MIEVLKFIHEFYEGYENEIKGILKFVCMGVIVYGAVLHVGFFKGMAIGAALYLHVSSKSG